MNKGSGAPFPLNVGYHLIRPLEGDNDGLVSVESAKWGHFRGILSPQKKRGISHGDMIDLTRKNVPGFDVARLYVDIVRELKEKGL